MKKSLVFLVLTAAALPAADFHTGQAARLVIGQRTFTSAQPGASDILLGSVSGVAYAGDMLFVADGNRLGATPENNRVLIFKNLSSTLPGLKDEIAQDGSRCPVCTGKADVVLGQPDFAKSELKPAAANTLRTPTAVASDGRILVIADTDNNRVLIWRSIPSLNQQNADIVLGQEDFTKTLVNEGRQNTPTNRGFRGPQGVWLQNGKLFVADTQNHRVLIWNSVPTSNFQPADVVLGQPDFNSATQPDLTKATLEPKANSLLNPVSVSSDGMRLYVTDLGHNRVLIWNTIPTTNQAPADVVVGQPDMTSALANNSTKLCPSKGQDEDGKDIFPARCAATLDFPRFALSDGTRLFIADGGNDRILIYNSVPTGDGRPADRILGQFGEEINLTSEAIPLRRSSADSTATPMSLAWDGTNLFVSDPFNRRVLVFSVGDLPIPNTGVRNAASRDIFAVGSVAFSGEVKENDQVTIRIGPEDGGKEYAYKILKDDDFDDVITALVNQINAGEGNPLALATPNTVLNAIMLTARVSGEDGNGVAFGITTSTNAVIIGSTSGATLSGGQDAAKIAPGTLVKILGENFSDTTASAPDAETLPRELAGVQVYMDGIRAPLIMVSPTEINAQLPFEVLDATSVNAFVRTVRRNGEVTVSTATGVPIVPQNPGIFADDGVDPRPGVILHGSSRATGVVSVDGSIKAGEVATVIIEDREYSYTTVEGDTLASVRDHLIELINADEKVEAFAAGTFTRIRLRARQPGPAGVGIAYSARAAEGGQVILTATGSALCCANQEGARVTEDNPALPGETLIVYATGLGLVKPDEARDAMVTGAKYRGPEQNEPNEFVSSLAGGKTANVLGARLLPGAVGIYEVILELNSDIPTNPRTQVTIAQDIYVSNIVTFPVVNPVPPAQ